MKINKEEIKSFSIVSRHNLDNTNDCALRRAIRELKEEGILFVPDYENGIYRKVSNIHDLSPKELSRLEKWQMRELRKAISLIKQVRKVQKITQSQVIRNLMGNLELNDE